MFEKWWHCPLAYQERYVNRLEPRQQSESLAFGSIVHELLARHFRGDLSEPDLSGYDQTLVGEAEAMVAAYKAHYPVEDFEVVECERVLEVQLAATCSEHADPVFMERLATESWQCPYCQAVAPPAARRHTLVFKADIILRRGGKLHIMDHKTEKRGSRGNSEPAWSSKPQVSLYQWGGQQVFGEEFGDVIVDVLTRQSPKGQEPPGFRRDSTVVRTPEQIQGALRDLVWVADQIETMEATGYYPANRNNCFTNWKCDYYDLHVPGVVDRTELVKIRFREAEPYLELKDGTQI